MPNTNETPNLHLALGTDADENSNWEKIDAVISMLAGPGIILPGDTEVQGNLLVDGDADIQGLLRAHGGFENFSGASFLSTVQISGLLTVLGGLTVSGAQPVVFPPGAIQGAALAPNAAIHAVGVSTAVTPGSGTMRVTRATPATPMEVTSLTLPSTEDQGRWELVIAQVTMEAYGQASSFVIPQIDLRRGAAGTPVVQQSRQFTYGGGLPITDFPLTIVRIGIPSDLSHRWSLGWGTAGGSGVDGTAWADILFAQLYAIQFA